MLFILCINTTHIQSICDANQRPLIILGEYDNLCRISLRLEVAWNSTK